MKVQMTLDMCKHTCDVILLVLSTLKMDRKSRRNLQRIGRKFVPGTNTVYLKRSEIDWIADLSDWALAVIHDILKDKKMADQSTQIEESQQNFEKVRAHFKSINTYKEEKCKTEMTQK